MKTNDNQSQKREYCIYIHKTRQLIPVTEEVYYEFKRPAWREHKQKKVRLVKELSLEVFSDSGYEIPSDGKSVDGIVEDKMLLEQLLEALDTLSIDERALIDEMFYKGKSERELAKELDISSISVHKRKHKILEKLKTTIKY